VGALRALMARSEKQVFTVSAVYAEMVARGTAYTEVTVFKTMQRMKEVPVRPPYLRLERAGRDGSRLLGDDTSAELLILSTE
jgi:hypothetical protein